MGEELEGQVGVPELKIPTERKKVTLPSDLLIGIYTLINDTKGYTSYSDFVTTACDFVLELDSAQEHAKICYGLANDLMPEKKTIYKDTIPLDFKNEKLPENTGYLFITFPYGLSQRLKEVALEKGIKTTDLVRYCVNTYYNLVYTRIDIDRGAKLVLAEAIEAITKAHYNKKS